MADETGPPRSNLFGAIAIYFSAQVGSCWRAGSVQGAEKASRMALIRASSASSSG